VVAITLHWTAQKHQMKPEYSLRNTVNLMYEETMAFNIFLRSKKYKKFENPEPIGYDFLLLAQ
jgi:hypothetical protein